MSILERHPWVPTPPASPVMDHMTSCYIWLSVHVVVCTLHPRATTASASLSPENVGDATHGCTLSHLTHSHTLSHTHLTRSHTQTHPTSSHMHTPTHSSDMLPHSYTLTHLYTHSRNRLTHTPTHCPTPDVLTHSCTHSPGTLGEGAEAAAGAWRVPGASRVAAAVTCCDVAGGAASGSDVSCRARGSFHFRVMHLLINKP